MAGTMSADAKRAMSRAQKRRWALWRQQQASDPPVRRRRRVSSLPVPDPLPIGNTPSTNGAIAEMSVTLHLRGQAVQLTSDEAAAVYDALGVVLHRHGISVS